MSQAAATYKNLPDNKGHFGIYGGRYVSETLMPLILSVEAAWGKAKTDPTIYINNFFDHFNQN